jgi:hypothetical protein
MSTEKDVTHRRRSVEDAQAGTLPDNNYHPVGRTRPMEEREHFRARFNNTTTTEARDRAAAPRQRLVETWHRVVIRDDEVADINARGLMSEYVMAHLAYVVRHGLPDDDDVYHDTHGERGHVYYFSPQASAIGADVLRLYSATACPEPENLTELRKQDF